MAVCDGRDQCLIDLFQVTSDEEQFLDFLVNHGLINGCMPCGVCRRELKLKVSGSKLVFSCRKRSCNFHESAKRGTFLETHIPPVKVILFIAFWLLGNKPLLPLIKNELKLSSDTITNWASYCREVTVDWATRISTRVGGAGTVVEIDEAKFGERKYRCRRVEGQWVFCGVERGSKRFFLVPVNSRDSTTLLNIIKEYVLPGTTLISDCWRTYDCLQDERFRHLEVNIRESLPSAGRGKKFNFTDYLAEHLFKTTHPPPERIHEFLLAVAKLYPPEVPNYDGLNMEPTVLIKTEPDWLDESASSVPNEEMNTVFLKQEPLLSEDDDGTTMEEKEKESHIKQEPVSSLNEETSAGDDAGETEDPLDSEVLVHEDNQIWMQLGDEEARTAVSKHVCKECGKSFGSKSVLTAHSVIHSGKDFSCADCDKIFSDKHSLQRHVLNHMEDRPFTCDECGRSFRTQRNLNLHAVVHREKNYRCTVCAQEFSLCVILKNHLKTHNGQGVYFCKKCKLGFSQLGLYREHRNIHLQEESYPCPDCGKVFSTNYLLKRHLGLHQSKKLNVCSCSDCTQ